MSNSVETSQIVPQLIGGTWSVPSVATYTNVYNPSTGAVIAHTPMAGADTVDAAVQAASRAFESWSKLPVPKRADILFRYRTLLEANSEALARLITRENGKTLEEARGDVRRGFEVVEFACGIAHLSKGESLAQVAPHIDGQTLREPLGVCAGISPYNFPAMVPMWMFPLAIACGNTFILKPSEKVPLTAVRLAELFQEAGLPDGVFNVIHGGREVVDALCVHPGIKAISFVGSSTVAKHVYALGSAHGKRVQAGGGAKNALVVMPDADPDSTLRAIMGSAFGCAGQRCMAGSLLMGVGSVNKALHERLNATLDAIRIGDTSADDTVDMGPVIDDLAQNRLDNVILQAEQKGIHIARDGRKNRPEQGFFVGPTLFDGITPDAHLFQEELFGPLLSMVHPKTLDEAIGWLNRLNFGNGAVIFTSSGAAARQFSQEINCGMVGVNVGVPAPMSLFPFAGWNDSFYGDLHMQGTEGVQFYTRQRVVLSRWDSSYHRQMGW
ncbi:CoA-acylating methylmalonate-semialdehyde dehydrogenase [Larkinella bovis]|uniref:methylmalonate-semialdehyde dehydrogenase (CoA acylating) n=1 Tax=Larkinella bovis TaxID=683041 RepID=A0ABW0IEK7_9BACT